jgi:hypothetical protein
MYIGVQNAKKRDRLGYERVLPGTIKEREN